MNIAAGHLPGATVSGNSCKGSKKVRTGCVTCKARKVKCDEAKPTCIRCTKAGRACGGYGGEAKQDPASNTHVSVPRYLSLMPDLNKANEQRAFQFFHQITAPTFALDFDSGFWNTLILNLCHSEKAVRHAVIAVSSYHESLTHPESGISRTPVGTQLFALQQYSKAITILRQGLGSLHHNPIVLLLMCILFVCIEFMQRNEVGSIKHLQQGRQMLRQYLESGSLTKLQCNLIRDNIVPLYVRSGATAFLFGYTVDPLPEELNTFANIPLAFSTVEEARNTFHSLMDRIMRSMFKAREVRYVPKTPQEILRALESEQQILLSLLSSWTSAFAIFQATEPEVSKLTPSVLILLLYCHAAKIWISTSLTPEEIDYDQHIDSFSAILPLASRFLKLTASDRAGHTDANRQRKDESNNLHTESSYNTGASSPEGIPNVKSKSIFSFETQVIPTLYFVAVKCRHPAIRQTALNLLEKNEHRQENLWQASSISRVAARFIEIESRNALETHVQVSGTPQHILGTAQSQEIPETILLADSGSTLPPPRMIHPTENSMDKFCSSREAFSIDLHPSTPQSPSLFELDNTPHGALQHEDFSISQKSQSPLGSTNFTPYRANNQQSRYSDVCEDTLGLGNGQIPLGHPPVTPRSSGLFHQDLSENNSSLLFAKAPYGLPEGSRVTDGVIGHQEGNGRWMKFFKKPADPGGEWTMWEEFILTS